MAGIQAALGNNNQVISAILEDQAVANYSSFDSTVKIEKDLTKCSESI